MTRDQQIHTIDLALRSISVRRGDLDSEEARWLREAEAAQIWIPLGHVSMRDYMERALGYTPRVATERLRVAHALAELPILARALAAGALPYSALRELTRVATPATEAAWSEAATGKNVRQIEELVATHTRGDHPDDPGGPDLRPKTIRFDVSPATYARLREAQAALDAEHGERLDDDRFVAALCGLALDEPEHAHAPHGRAKFQVATTICARCEQGWQTGGGATVAVGSDVVARAQCDAEHIGSLTATEPARATQDVSPKTRRFVWRRDAGRCVVPGCRSARNLEIHHLVPRSAGGKHHASNLALLCDAHHSAHHVGTLAISGVAPEAIVFAAAPMQPPREMGAELPSKLDAEGSTSLRLPSKLEAEGSTSLRLPSKLDTAVRRVEVRSALVNMGWKPAIASAAVDEAIARLGVGGEIGELVREALRCCPR